jgi:glycosyltransferase involved in cell wall biosynthesis
MRILQLISSQGLYGAENVLLNLSTELNRQGHSCIVGAFQDSRKPNTEVTTRAQELGLPTAIIPCRGQADWGAVRAIRALVKKNETDLIHTHGYKADLYVYAAQMKSLPAALVATCHNWPGRSVAMRSYAMLDRWALRRFDRVAAVSEVVARTLLASGIKESQVAYIANGVPIPERKAQPSLALEINKGKRVLIGTVARLSSEKGLNFFLDAARQLTTQFPETLFVIVGEGPERAALEQQVKALGLEENVIFAGARSDLAGVYASLDVFLMTSLNEGMPLALLEAMAAGVPVVATRVGAIPSLIPDASKGSLIEPGSAAAIVQGITPLLSDGELRRKVGENAREHVREKFSAGRMAERYLQLYAEAAQHRASRRKRPVEAGAGVAETQGRTRS